MTEMIKIPPFRNNQDIKKITTADLHQITQIIFKPFSSLKKAIQLTFTQSKVPI